MAYRSGHGGGCCGINHIRNFTAGGMGGGFNRGIPTREELRALIGDRGGRWNNPRGRSMLLEVVLTNRQCAAHPDLPVMLQEEGFKLVSRFSNPNSGNICNVFHYNKHPRSLTQRLPFPIVERLVQEE